MVDVNSGFGAVDKAGHAEMADTLVKVLTDTFIAEAAHLTIDDISEYARLMMINIAAASVDSRASVARKLATCDIAPAALIRRLVQDVEEVAVPVLTSSNLLQTIDLLAIIRDGSSAKREAIARRDDLSPALIRALIDCKDLVVVESLVMNRDAPIGDFSASLVPFAVNYPLLASELVMRDDVRTERMVPLFWDSSSNARQKILETLSQLLPDLGAQSDGSSKFGLRASDIGQVLASLAIQRKKSEIAAFFTTKLNISTDVAEAVLSDASGEPFAVACKALSLPTNAFSTLLILYNPDVGQSVSTVFSLVGLYGKLTTAACEKVLEQWRGSGAQHVRPHMRVPVLVGAEAAAQRQDALTEAFKVEGSKVTPLRRSIA